ncbi:uncharacterized protein LOC109846663, partial [Asparagus officinalis]|uniref:uncharacterized protein LOC109846663 n=1 Tax=Asparagus officinalis TaxID=4686 RepID=UPI00098E5614
MTTMSDDGDRTCPLCAEEMDLTDQQLKPCRCGYEICVWCWHHIMEMAEKEGAEGRCPACRTTYDKQRIVGMAANCKRMVAEISSEKKQKPQKPKSKSSSTVEDRKHLSSVRVVQRNLVYVMGMPSNLSDENILERKEYFGQYGKVLKVSVSRQAGATSQQAANNNTFSVYITYAREEEAVRCIQAVHNFVLEDKALRACFGTTKYCYTWLRNMTCNNPDCLYLHDIGSQEDSFTKDEIISAYTRSRVPQIPSNNLQPRAGNVLPPPVDDLYCNGAVPNKQAIKNSFNVKSSSFDTSGARSTVLPAAASWGMRASSCRSPSSDSISSQTSLKQKIEVLDSSSSSSMVSGTKQNSAWHDNAITPSKVPEGKSLVHTDGRSKLLEPFRRGNGRDHLTKVSDVSSRSSLDVDHSSISAWDDDIPVAKLPNGKQTMHVNDSFRNKEMSRRINATSVSNVGEDIILDESRHSAWDDDTVFTSNMPAERQIVHNNDIWPSETLEPGVTFSKTSISDVTSKALPDVAHASGVSVSCSSGQLALQHENSDRSHTASTVNSGPVNITCSEGVGCELSSSCLDTNITIAVNGNAESLCLGLSSVNLDTPLGIDQINQHQQHNSITDQHVDENFGNLSSRLHQHYPENGAESSTSFHVNNAPVIPDAHVHGKLSDWKLEPQKQVLSSTINGIGDATAIDDPRHRLSEITNLSSCASYKNYSSDVSNSNQLTSNSQSGVKLFSDGDSRILGAQVNNHSLYSNGYHEQIPSSFVKPESVCEYPSTGYTGKEVYSSSFDNILNMEGTATVDTKEEHIVSKMLSSDFDIWDNSWSSANDFAKLLAQMNKQEGPSKQSTSWKPQNTNQSRFSFARQGNQSNLVDIAYRDTGFAQQQVPSNQEAYGSCFGNDFPVSNFDHLNASSSTISSDTNAGIMRSKISAPPGFSAPNRAPPPGFSSQDRYVQSFSTCSDSQLLGSALQNQFQVHATNIVDDVEFIDPAILAVGKGRLPIGVNNTGLGSRPAFHQQLNTSESDARIPLLMQQSISANQDPRIPSYIGDRFSQLNDAYTSSRFSAQNSSLSQFSQIPHQQPSRTLNGQWSGWNDIQ